MGDGSNSNFLKVAKMEFVPIDVETTGFSPATDDIIEVAAIKIDSQRRLVNSFSALVKTKVPVSHEITKLTGITQKMVDEEGEDPASVLSRLKRFIGKSLLVAHKATFDHGFLALGMAKQNIELPETRIIDSLKISKYFARNKLVNYKLGTVAEHFGFVLEEGHRALADTEALAHIIIEILKEHSEEQLLAAGEPAEFKKPSQFRFRHPEHLVNLPLHETGILKMAQDSDVRHGKILFPYKTSGTIKVLFEKNDGTREALVDGQMKLTDGGELDFQVT